MEKIVIICCPTYENITEEDKKEIYNLIKFKEMMKKRKEIADKDWYKLFL